MEKNHVNHSNNGNNIWYGKHILLDMHDITLFLSANSSASYLDTLYFAAKKAGATILHRHIHSFDDGGLSAMVILAESHISMHLWLKEKFAAVDVYMCGDCDPSVAIDYILDVFEPKSYHMREFKRGEIR